MRCERCQGIGVCPSFRYAHMVVVGEPRRIVNSPYPCPECGGSGITSCCEVHDAPADPEDRGVSDEPVDIRRDEHGAIDEIVAHGVDVQIERMDDDLWSVAIGELRFRIQHEIGPAVVIEDA